MAAMDAMSRRDKYGGHLNVIEKYRQERKLVSLKRDSVDDQKIQGFVLGTSEKLVLLQYVFDFYLDGLMVLRTEDISEIVRTKTDSFQQSLMEHEDLLAGIPFENHIDLTSWRTAIVGLQKRSPLFILECELLESPSFSLGKVVRVDGRAVAVQTFDGCGKWAADPLVLQCDEITSCQVNTNYARAYERYFERSAL